MNNLIEDTDGAPYPTCANCPDQIAPVKDTNGKTTSKSGWVHVFADEDGYRWFLHNCQRPNVGRYGMFSAER